jgi:hypothetical protein
MAYKLYLDKPEVFECEVAVKNASLKNSMARLVVESTDGMNYIFKGSIENEKCIIPIKRLKGFLDENSKGNMHLEIIVEDTYFQPWKSDFIVEEHTSVKVKVNENKKSTKPLVEVKVPTTGKKVMNERKGINVYTPLKELSIICEKFGINKSTLRNKKNDFQQIVQEYFNMNPDLKSHKTMILNGLKHFLK